MKRTFRNHLIALCLAVPGLGLAADIPDVVEGDEQMNAATCVEQAINDCINNICLTSEERDCQDQCKAKAADKCKENMEE